MKKVLLIVSAIFTFLFSALWTLVALFALIDPEDTDKSLFYFIGGTAVIGFVISWLLFDIARRK